MMPFLTMEVLTTYTQENKEGAQEQLNFSFPPLLIELHGVGPLNFDQKLIREVADQSLAQLGPNDPLEDDLVAKLTRLDVGDPNFRDEDCGSDCCVCLEPLDSFKIRITTPCSHSFHEECMLGWLKVQSTCPICKANLRDSMGSVDKKASRE